MTRSTYLTALLALLSWATAARTQQGAAAASGAPTPTGIDSTRAPHSVPKDAIGAATRDYHASGVARTITQGTAVTYPFGHAQPTVTCAVLRVCVIELEAGEVLVDRPIAGDTVRWRITPAVAGPNGATRLVVVKPTDCDLTTNLVLPTDRRIYDLTLDAPPCKPTGTNPQQPYTRQVRFYYPDDAPDAWTTAPQPPAREPPSVRTPPNLATLDFAYHVSKDKDFPWMPAQVFDDGARVYIKLPASARHDEAPVLFVLQADGSRTLLNYTLVHDVYVTDRLFDRAVLVTGAGGKERRLTIEHSGTRDSGTPQ